MADGAQILAPNNDAFNKIPYTRLNEAFANNDQDTIVNVLEYHILQGKKMTAQLVPGTPAFFPTLLTSTKWANVSGGQNVQNVKQAGDMVIFVSGEGNRATLTQSVCICVQGLTVVKANRARISLSLGEWCKESTLSLSHPLT